MSETAQCIAQLQFCYEYFDPNIAPMQQTQSLLFSKRLTEFPTFHAIQSYTFQELRLAFVLLLLFHHCVPAETTADSDKCLPPFVINICWKVVEKKSLCH